LGRLGTAAPGRELIAGSSLEKILARGISTLIGSLLLLGALVLVGTLLFSAATALRRRDWSPRAVALATAAGVVLLIVGLAFTSPVLASALILSLAVGVAGARFVPELPRAWILATQYLVVLAGLIASAYVYPQPLPIAHVEVSEGGTPVVGDLVTTTDFSWYVAGFADDAVRAIPATDIEDAEFLSREREDPTMLKDLVSDAFE
jgi:hypothetical protein